MSNAPLDAVSVVEMTAHRAGPFCGALLADLGADVVKIERPGVGDPARDQGPGPDGLSGYFQANNRNKRSVTLDLKTDAGLEAAQELIAAADVFIENFGYGVTDRLGIGYETMREQNPDLVYASVKGYGETGPDREKPGLDLILQAEGGIMSITGPEGGDPVKVGQAIGDLTAGMFATIGILARLNQRNRVEEFNGKLDVGLFDSIVCLLNEYLTWYSMNGHVPEPQGTSHQTLVPYQLFETADGFLVTGVPSDDRWTDFVDVIGREELRDYPTNAERVEQRETVIGIIQEELSSEPTAHWLEALRAANFPAGPLNDVEDVVHHEQATARGLVREHVDATGGECLLPGHPVNYAEYDTSIDRPAPALGAHTDEVFAELGDQTTLDEWRAAGAFGD
jgi:crotonobetainyl-CoA:carnitine CoA-transferase CaiB-like acyl-CoA transferase